MTQEELNQELIKAVMNGNISEVTKLLESGADLHTKTVKGNNLVYVAASRKKREMFDWLLQIEQNGKKIDLDIRNTNGSTLLLDAVQEGDMLHYIEKLLSAGANPNIPNNSGMTPLIQAVADGKVEDIKLLLKSPKIDVNYEVEGTKTTAFLMATTASTGVDTLEICKLLIDAGANINAQDVNGKNALINAVFRTKQFMKKKEKEMHLEMCKFLIEQNINLDYTAPSGMTAFWMATANGDKEIVKLLLEKNVKTDVWHSIGTEGLSSSLHNLMHSIKSAEDLEMIEKTVQLGANINAPDEEGNTPAVIGYVNPNAREMTIALGGDVNAILHQKDAKKNIIKTPAISIVIRSGDNHQELVQEMINRGAKVSFENDPDLNHAEPIVIAMLSSAKGIVDMLLQTKQVNVNMVLNKGTDKEISLLSLLASGAINSDFKKILSKKQTLEAIIKGKEENDKNGVVSPLINDEGLQAVQEELQQINQLEEELKTNKKEIVSLLINHGADVNLTFNKGRTALFYADTKVDIDMLLENGADLFVQNDNGDDVLISSIKNNMSGVSQYLLEKFKDAKHSTVENLFYQLAFVESPNAYQRDAIEHGVLSLLSEEQIKVLFPEQPKDPNEPKVEPGIVQLENINYQDEDGNSPLLVSSATGNSFLTALYLRLGADINLANNNGETPLMHTIASGNHKAVEFMIKQGADIHAQTTEGKTVLEFAEEADNMEILEAVKIALGHGIEEGQLTGYRKLKR